MTTNSPYQLVYRVITGLTRKYSIDIVTVGKLWRAGSPEVRALLAAQYDIDRLWAAIEVAEHGTRKARGSGHNNVLQLPKRVLK